MAMVERQQREKQHISIPYLWEDKPGLPKKAWTSQGAAATAMAAPSSPSPAMLAVSVPFEWEEKPGKPIRPTTATTTDLLISTEMDPLPAPELYLNPFDEIAHPLNPFIDQVEGGEEDTAASDLEAFSFEMNADTVGVAKTDQSFPAFPDAWESFSENGSYWNENWKSASETDGGSRSSSSVAEDEVEETSVIEFLFPLASPGTSFPSNSVKDEAPAPMAAREDTATARRMLTLEELILLSRKLSCRRKQISLKNTNHKKEDLKKSVLRYFPFIYNSNKRSGYISNWCMKNHHNINT